MAELIGTTIGNYRVESLLGTGGMGQVYLGVHLHLNRPAAVKVMHAHLAGEEAFTRRFRQEARAVAALSHPHIVQTWDFGSQDGNYYLVMELLTDGSLRSLIGSDEAAQPGWAIHVGLDLVRQAAEGLAYAHKRGMIHRDIKPDNLLVQRLPDDLGDDDAYGLSVKITDFGLARMTEEASATGPSLVMGTPAFMSPELCQGLPFDGRSDIYSLGVILYQITTGRLPFEARTAAEAVYKHVHAAPPRPSEYWPEIPPRLEEVILRCLAKDPNDRFGTASELARALRGLRAELAPLAPSPTPPGGVSSYRTPSPLPLARPLPTPRSAAVAQVIVSAVGGAAHQVVDLGIDGLTIGSLPDNDLVIDDSDVFGRHLRIDWDGEQASVTDLGSSSGTTLGVDSLMPHVMKPWHPVDEVRLGSRSLRLLPPGAGAIPAVGETIATPVPAAAAADAATVMVVSRDVAVASPTPLVFRLPVLAVAAVIAVVLSVGGLQALTSSGDAGGADIASLIAVDDGEPATPTVLVTDLEPTETPAPAETPISLSTFTSTPEPTSTERPTATRTPTTRPSSTPEPTATQPAPPPPVPTRTPVPPTATPPTPPPPAPTSTPEPTAPAPTPTPEPTVPVEPTAPQELEPTPEPTEEPVVEPTAPAEPTPEPEATPDDEPTTVAHPESEPRPIETPAG